VAVTGKDTLWRGHTISGADLEGDWRNKILLVEIPRSDILWLEPRDISVQDAFRLFAGLKRSPYGGNFGHCHYVTVDGKVGALRSIRDDEQFAQMLSLTRIEE
jgi:hypothetical protein